MSTAAGWRCEVLQSHGEISADDPRVLAIVGLIREELEREAAAGFPTLQRIPSTGVIKLLDVFAALSPAGLARLIANQAHLAALLFFPAPLIARAHDELRTAGEPANLALAAALQAPAFSYGLRYCDLRMHRMMLNDPQSRAQLAATRAQLDFTPRDDLPEALVGTTPIRDIVTAKAPLLRKLLNQMLRGRLSFAMQKRPGGELVYEGAVGGIPLRVSIIFSNLYAQMHYRISWSARERGLLAQHLSYEVLWGANTGWDYLTEENAPRSIDLLHELLARLAQLCDQVLALPELV
jgi:hypothetical protein